MKKTLRVLVVDDEAMSARVTVKQLRDEGYLAESCTNGAAALDLLAQEPHDVVLSDLRMPNMDGLELLGRVKQQSSDTFVILMSAYGTVATAVAAMKAGASDFLIKPFPLEVLTVRLEKLRELCEARREISSLKAILGSREGPMACGIVGRSPKLKVVWERILTFAGSSAPVLIVGETGTGKELVARAIHHHSPRQRRPFISVACGAIPAELAESELFGHVKGAFTGATQQRKGVFERADGGTLLLDDVDDLPRDIQVKLLRVLQEGTLTRVGGGEQITVDVRLVATTKVDLSNAAVSDGPFRADLFFRLRGLEINLPPLRERGEDILLLATHFLNIISAQEGVGPKRLTAEVADLLRRHAWPGNVRELRRAMESSVLLSAGPEVGPLCLPEYLRARSSAPSDGLYSLHLDRAPGLDFKGVISAVEADILQWALQKAEGNQIKAAELLNLPRTTFQNKIKQL